MPDLPSDADDSSELATGHESSSIPLWYWLVYLTGGFGLAFNAMMVFLLPLRAHDLGISIGMIGLLLGAKGAVEAVVSPPVRRSLRRSWLGSRLRFLTPERRSTPSPGTARSMSLSVSSSRRVLMQGRRRQPSGAD